MNKGKLDNQTSKYKQANPPSFLPFALPEIGQEEIAEVVDSLNSGWLTTGPKASKFENDFSEYLQMPYALAVVSGTAGLHLALEAVGVGPGDEVVTTPYTFTASAEVIRYLGADPVFVDIVPNTFNIDPQKIEDVISEKVRAILPVHFGGQACDMAPIIDIAHDHKL
jgi:dTDP-4-amino-4,6-dideoxygalactose transaminase